MDPLSIASIVIGGTSLLTSLGFSTANALKDSPKVQGATSGELLSQASTRQLANKLQSGQGMSDTAYNARMSGASDAVAKEAAAAAGAIRGSFNMPGVVADRLLREAFSKGRTYMAKTQESLTMQDIETSLQNLRASAQAEQVASQAAAQVGSAERMAELKNLQFKMMKEEALTKSLLGITQGTAGLLNAVSKMEGIADGKTDTTATTNAVQTPEEQRLAELQKEYPTNSELRSLDAREKAILAGENSMYLW